LLCASCHETVADGWQITHYNPPYDDSVLRSHTIELAVTYTMITGDAPVWRPIDIHYSNHIYAGNEVGGYLTANGIHIAITDRIEQSAIWHELTHLALCTDYDDCDQDHTQADIWEAVSAHLMPPDIRAGSTQDSANGPLSTLCAHMSGR
jgi:hypothetical protein